MHFDFCNCLFLEKLYDSNNKTDNIIANVMSQQLRRSEPRSFGSRVIDSGSSLVMIIYIYYLICYFQFSLSFSDQSNRITIKLKINIDLSTDEKKSKAKLKMKVIVRIIFYPLLPWILYVRYSSCDKTHPCFIKLHLQYV